MTLNLTPDQLLIAGGVACWLVGFVTAWVARGPGWKRHGPTLPPPVSVNVKVGR